MSVIHRVLKLGVLAVLAATVTGCIVLPYGARGRHGHGGYYAGPAEGQPIMQPAPREHRRGDGHGR
ncbi:MAG: hypothetical protein IPF94_17355 [Betaproteobacteria bacterium]|nr:hypothetical protein [Betaproteobacteria bacterium]